MYHWFRTLTFIILVCGLLLLPAAWLVRTGPEAHGPMQIAVLTILTYVGLSGVLIFYKSSPAEPEKPWRTTPQIKARRGRPLYEAAVQQARPETALPAEKPAEEVGPVLVQVTSPVAVQLIEPTPSIAAEKIVKDAEPVVEITSLAVVQPDEPVPSIAVQETVEDIEPVLVAPPEQPTPSALVKTTRKRKSPVKKKPKEAKAIIKSDSSSVVKTEEAEPGVAVTAAEQPTPGVTTVPAKAPRKRKTAAEKKPKESRPPAEKKPAKKRTTKKQGARSVADTETTLDNDR